MKGGKTGGRKKGTPNRMTYEIRESFKKFVSDEFETFVKDWRSIKDPKDKTEIFIKACKFVIPALQSVSLSSEGSRDKSIEEQLRKLAEAPEN